MKKTLLLFISLFSITLSYAQNVKNKKPKMDFYVNPTLNLGYNLGNSIQDDRNKDSAYYQQYIAPYLPNKITFGMTVIGGYNFLPNFALGSGIKYSFTDKNFHLLYWVIQPKFIIGPGDEPFFIDINYGKQINHSVVSNAEFWGIKLGKQVSYSKRLSQEGGLVLENHNFGKSNAFFIGLSYGITFFSNKNYTGYGDD